MAEPSSTTAGAVAVATGLVTLTGSIVGLQYDALLFGLLGGLVSLMHISVGSPFRMAMALATASLCGALASQISPAAAHAYFEWTKALPLNVLRLSSAFLVGLVAQVVIPLGLGWLDGFIKNRTPGGQS